MTVIDVKRLERAVRGHVYQYALTVEAALPEKQIMLESHAMWGARAKLSIGGVGLHMSYMSSMAG